MIKTPQITKYIPKYPTNIMKKLQYTGYNWFQKHSKAVTALLEIPLLRGSFTFNDFYFLLREEFSCLEHLRQQYLSEEQFKKELEKGLNQLLPVFKLSRYHRSLRKFPDIYVPKAPCHD